MAQRTVHRPTRASAGQRAPIPVARTSAVRNKPVILVVDDDPDCRTIYATYLRVVGCKVFTANDGRDALNKIDRLSPDVIVMDLAMPRMDGWEAIRTLHESSWTRQIPVIAVSAVPVSRETAFEAGCDAYLSKPCDPVVLWSQICALLRLPPSGSLDG
jgi:CheY-like chemotaxis protein